jgi:hypothetical protein
LAKIQHAFPPDFPPALATGALVLSNEAAWSPALAATVVEWLEAHGFAVLGTEAWRPQGLVIQSVPYFQSANRKADEDWNSFVSRAAAETIDYLKAFDGEFAKEGELFINIFWVSESEFQDLKAT